MLPSIGGPLIRAMVDVVEQPKVSKIKAVVAVWRTFMGIPFVTLDAKLVC
jgi:hypothetical protein